MQPASKLLTVSVVSHGQQELILPLLRQLAEITRETPLKVVVTENLPEPRLPPDAFPGLDIGYIRNASPKGFGANHNAAFARCDTPYFCVANPDVRLVGNPFPALVARLRVRPGVAAPRVVAENGAVEDSARRVPRVSVLLGRFLARLRGRSLAPDYAGDGAMPVDWAAGMFLLFDAAVFRGLHGFDHRYFLYCEDVDVCLRTWLHGHSVSWVNQAVVRHDARRDSHRRLRYLRWHVSSMVRLLSSRAYWRFRLRFRTSPGNIAGNR